MSKKSIFWVAYFSIAVLFAIYGTFWGEESYRGFFYNLGGSLVWPVTIFPSLGGIISGIVWLIVIAAAVTIFRKK